jgi:hypothetical protein
MTRCVLPAKTDLSSVLIRVVTPTVSCIRSSRRLVFCLRGLWRVYKQQPVLYALGLEVVAIAGVTNISDIKLPC